MGKPGEITPEIEANAKLCADMAQRSAMRIAEMPLEQREEGFKIAERSLREAAEELGIGADRMEGLIQMLVKGMRQFVLDIDVGGSPKGGRA